MRRRRVSRGDRRLTVERRCLDQVGLGHADGVHDHEPLLGGRVGSHQAEVALADHPRTAALHLLEVGPAADRAHEEDALERPHVGAGGDHVHGHGDARERRVAELADHLVARAPGGLVGDLDGEVVSPAELLADDLDDLLRVGVVLGEDEGLRHGRAAGEDLREEAVPERPHDGADLVARDDGPIEGLRAVGDLVVQLLPARRTGLAVPELGDDPGLDGPAALGDLGPDPVHVEVHVHGVRDGLLVGVLHHQVLVEEPERLLVGSGGEADHEGVEVVDHLSPHAVDRAVALVHDHDVEGLDRHRRAVVHRHRIGRREVERRALVQLGVEFRVPAQRRVEPLDGRDRDPGDGVDRVGREVLDVVELGELAPVVGRGEGLELLERLAPEVGPVDQEEDAARAGVLDQPVRDVGGGEGLARAGRHLDERAGAARGQRVLQVADGRRLGGPESGVVELRHGAKPGAERRGEGARPEVGPRRERLGPMEPEHRPARRIGIERVGEPGLDAGGLVREGERALERRGDVVGKAVEVLARLPGDPGERLPLLLGLDHTDGTAVDEEQVVRAPVGRAQHELANGHPPSRTQVGPGVVLHRPPRGREHAVDLDPCARLGREVGDLGLRHRRESSPTPPRGPSRGRASPPQPSGRGSPAEG
jgi:hypothetical protein